MGRKHCGKRRNCLLREISPFPTVFSKGLFPRAQKLSLCGSGSTGSFSDSIKLWIVWYMYEANKLLSRINRGYLFLSLKENKYSVYFMLLTLSGRIFIKIQCTSFPLFPVAYPFCIAMHYSITSSARNVR